MYRQQLYNKIKGPHKTSSKRYRLKVLKWDNSINEKNNDWLRQGGGLGIRDAESLYCTHE